MRLAAVLALALVAATASRAAAQGDLLVTDESNRTILRYDAASRAFAGRFDSGGGLSAPTGITVGPDGDVYVISAGHSSVERYNGATGAFVATFVPNGIGPLREPYDLAFGPDGHLYVSDQEFGPNETGAILRFNGQTGAFLGAFFTSQSGGRFNGFTIGPDGHFYATEPFANSVTRYDGQTGAFIDSFVPSGRGDLERPRSVVFGPDGQLYVSSAGGRVVRYDGLTGAYMSAFIQGGRTGPNAYSYIAFGPDGNFYGTTDQSGTGESGVPSGVHRFDGATGEFLSRLPFPQYPQGLVFAQAPCTTRIVLKSDDTTLGAATTDGLDTADTSGLTFTPIALPSVIRTSTRIPQGAPPGTMIVLVPGTGDTQSGFFKATFTLPASFAGARLFGAANVEDVGRVFLNGHALTPPIAGLDPGTITPIADATFSTDDASFFRPGLNELLISDANLDAGPTGGAFYAVVTFEPAVPTAACLAAMCVPPPSGLVGWWRGEGNADDQVGGRNGALLGNGSYVPAQVGRGFRLVSEGSGNVLLPPDPALLGLTTGSLEMWVQVLTLSANTVRLFGVAQTGLPSSQSDTWALDYLADVESAAPAHAGAPVIVTGGRLQVEHTRNGETVTHARTPPGTIADNGFHHIVVVADGVDPIQVYVDGVSVPLTTEFGPTTDRFFGHAVQADNIRIGAIGRDTLAADGDKVIDEVSIYSRALSGAEVLALFQASDAGKCTVSTRDNRPPVLTNPGNQTSAEGQVVSLQLSATDPDGDALTFSASGLPHGLNISASGLIAGTIAYDAAGVHTVTVTVSDGTLTDSRTFTWTVSDTNRPPLVTSPGDRAHAVGDSVTQPITATDPDGNALTFTATGLPRGLTIGHTSGVITGPLAAGAVGAYTTVVTVSDGAANTSVTFGWHVVATRTLSIGDVSVPEGASGTTPAVFTVTLSPPAVAPVTVRYATADGTAHAGSDYTAASGTLTFAPGDATRPITISVIGDRVYEPNETFFVNLSSPVGATLARARATGTIRNDASSTVVVSVFETIAVADQPGAVPPVNVSVVESLGVTDQSRAVPPVNVSVVESLGVTDQSRAVPPVNVSVVEPLGVTDQSGAVPPVNVSVVEPLGVTDQSGAVPPVNVSVVEPLGVADQSGAVPPVNVSVVEPLGVTDQPGAVPPVNVSIVESLGVGDQPGAVPPLNVGVTELLGVGDQSGAVPPATVQVDEPMSVGDAPGTTPPAPGSTGSLARRKP